MFPDPVGVVISYAGRSHKAGLDMYSHAQPVHVVTGLRITHQHAFIDHAQQIVCSGTIHHRVMRISGLRQVDFSLGNMQEAPRLPMCTDTRLGAAQYIIGWRNHINGVCTCWPQAGERTDQGHRLPVANSAKAALYTGRNIAAINTVYRVAA
jgi:hypothetical protein